MMPSARWGQRACCHPLGGGNGNDVFMKRENSNDAIYMIWLYRLGWQYIASEGDVASTRQLARR